MFKILQRPEPKVSRLIYLVATPGHPNYGDEVIVRRWLSVIAKVDPLAQVWVDCPNQGPAATLLRAHTLTCTSLTPCFGSVGRTGGEAAGIR